MTTCRHLKIYDAKLIKKKKPVFKWICSRCGEQGIEEDVIYNYDELELIIKDNEDE